MKKDNNKTKVLALISLTVAIMSITIGFTAYTRVLIVLPNANVSPNDKTFKVGFSTRNNSLVSGTVLPSLYSISYDVKLPKASNAVLNETIVNGINVDFSEPGQSVVYSFYVYNAGQFDAYLNQIIFSNLVGKNVNKVCTPGVGATKELVDIACRNIHIGIFYKPLSPVYNFNSVLDISNIKLKRNNFEEVKVMINYSYYNGMVDGPFTVTFGDIRLNYGVND